MTSPFDGCASRYESEVQSSIDFSGLRHDFFLAAKADILARTWSDHFGVRGRPAALDIGRGERDTARRTAIGPTLARYRGRGDGGSAA
jgi:hypothetical protein